MSTAARGCEPFRESGCIMPSTLPEDRLAAVLECAEQAVSAIGITNSMVHTEIMLTAAGPRVIEVNSRLGGGVIERLHLSYDYDIVSAMAAVATGRPTAPLGPLQRSSAYLVPQAPARDVVLAEVPSLEELTARPDVVEASLFYGVGDRPEWERGTAGGRLARVIAAADTPGQILDLADHLASDACFSYAPRTDGPAAPRRILVLGGTSRLLMKAEGAGLRMVNLREADDLTERAARLCQEVRILDLSDIQGVTRTVRDLHAKSPFSMVVCHAEAFQMLAGCLTSELGLLGNSFETARLLNDKFALRSLLREHGLSRAASTSSSSSTTPCWRSESRCGSPSTPTPPARWSPCSSSSIP